MRSEVGREHTPLEVQRQTGMSAPLEERAGSSQADLVAGAPGLDAG